MLVFINFDPFFGKMLIETSTEHFFELSVVDIWVGQQISIQARRDVKPRQFLAKIIYCRGIYVTDMMPVCGTGIKEKRYVKCDNAKRNLCHGHL